MGLGLACSVTHWVQWVPIKRRGRFHTVLSFVFAMLLVFMVFGGVLRSLSENSLGTFIGSLIVLVVAVVIVFVFVRLMFWKQEIGKRNGNTQVKNRDNSHRPIKLYSFPTKLISFSLAVNFLPLVRFQYSLYCHV
jgi:amino acid permease